LLLVEDAVRYVHPNALISETTCANVLVALIEIVAEFVPLIIISKESPCVKVGLAILPCSVGHAFCHAADPTATQALLIFL
jgi:hypothetical protein